MINESVLTSIYLTGALFAVFCSGLFSRDKQVRRFNVYLAGCHQIFNAGEFIQAELVKQAYTTIRLTDGSSHGYGFGWNMAEFLGEDIIWHLGSGKGYESTVIQISELSNMMVAVLNN